ncbi:MAG: ATP-dependent DNA helicase, partial [Acidimicrobiales bacterium]
AAMADLSKLRSELALQKQSGRPHSGRPNEAERARLQERHEQAQSRLDRADSTENVLKAEIAELREGAVAISEELAARQAQAQRVDMSRYLDGLGGDQAAAVVRFTDPSRPLDALIGPAGSGKTAALSRLTAAFNQAGRGVQVLAPTAVAARCLGDAVGAPHSTLHATVARWAKGRDLPGPGDLVLVDEASMATTPMLVEVARMGASRGALVRLVGDPRQLKAVGAGGGLSLVAEAAKSPELVELRRFEAPWEANATLGLRRGDHRALDAYMAHDRVKGSLDAVAIAEVFSAWWDSPAGRAKTLMVASSNDAVRQLNLLARHARIDAGEVQGTGVQLHDDTVAGVGDVVVTRLNRRLAGVGPNPGPGAYVRNGDRWIVEALGADGSVVLSQIERPGGARLPADYVAGQLELGYADTGHAVQGRTVERSEVLVQPADTRWYLYVAMSRATKNSTAHVVIDQHEEEPGGYHPVRAARDVLEAVLDRDDPVSATEWRRAIEAGRTDPALIAERMRTASAEELRRRLVVAMGARGAELLASEEGWRVIAAAIAAESVGLDAGAIVASHPSHDAGELSDALGDWCLSRPRHR